MISTIRKPTLIDVTKLLKVGFLMVEIMRAV